MMRDIILASKSKVRKDILSTNEIHCRVVPSNVDEDSVKISLTRDKASSEIISKNLAELKANKVSEKFPNELVIGADSVIDLNGEVISKPNNRNEALEILKSLNGKKHDLISSVCISMGGNMIWNYTDKAELFMKKFTLIELEDYLSKISDEALYAYNVYQIEGLGKTLFSEIKGDNDTIMGLPVKKIKEYLKNFN
ncbi:Maf family protein [Candidatus Pelagibacter sp.]|nr:Maf family protein [Candidatus Pelagibacter sp.]